VLAEVARRMSVTCRASDFIARMGGEEFLLILPDTDERGGEALGRKVLEWVSSLPVGPVEQVTVSIGLVSKVPPAGMAPAPLIEAADRALYRAKHAGRNRVEVGDPAELA
jgi:diguanylate cyclase (GGDEF)-like protein